MYFAEKEQSLSVYHYRVECNPIHRAYYCCHAKKLFQSGNKCNISWREDLTG